MRNNAEQKFAGAIALANHGEGVKAEREIVSLLNEFGEDRVRSIIMSQPASGISVMIQEGDGNDQSYVFIFMSPEQGLIASLLALQTEAAKNEEPDPDKYQLKAIEQLNQIFCSVLDLEEKYQRIMAFWENDLGRLFLLLAMHGIEEGMLDEDVPVYFDVSNEARDDNPMFVANELASLGFSEVVYWAHEELSRPNAPTKEALFNELVDEARKLAGANTTSRQRREVMMPL